MGLRAPYVGLGAKYPAGSGAQSAGSGATNGFSGATSLIEGAGLSDVWLPKSGKKGVLTYINCEKYAFTSWLVIHIKSFWLELLFNLNATFVSFVGFHIILCHFSSGVH